jgi:hypothetical protein
MVWSNQPTQPSENRPNRYLNLGLASVAMGGAFAYGLHSRPDDTRPIDALISVARNVGNLTPYQIGNTFRVPEFLSPFASPKYHRLTAKGGQYTHTWDAASLSNSSTYSYLKELTGLSDSQLHSFGIGSRSSKANLVFKKDATAVHGQLYSVLNGKESLLRSNVMLMQYTGERNEVLTSLGKAPEFTPVNKAIKSVFAAMDMWRYKDFKEGNVLLSGKNRPSLIPVPGIEASYSGTTYLRSIGAFQMERFNHLLGNIGGELFGSSLDKVFKRILGTGVGVASGPASSMFFRFGGKAALAGAIGIGAVAETDWIRRRFGTPGHMIASTAIAGGLGVLATRAGFKGKTGALIAGGAFIGQMLLPGFNKGVVPGLATSYTNLQLARASSLNPFNYYRRTVEGFLPGISGFGVAAGIGIAMATAPHLKIPGTGRRVPQILLDQLGRTTLGFKPKTLSGLSVEVPKTVRDIFWDKMMSHGLQELNGPKFAKIYQQYAANGHYSTMSMRNRLMREFYTQRPVEETSRAMEHLFAAAETEYDELAKRNPINHHMVDELTAIATRYSGKGDFISRATMQAEGLVSQLKHSFFGAVLHEESTAKAMASLGFKSPLGSFGLLFAAGATAFGIASGGLLGSMRTKEELEDIYSGRQLVEVKKGRFWEAGGTPWEGGLTSQLRPHWYPIMMSRAQQAGTWGSDEDNLDPISKWALSNFTYELERRNYYDRPYPISGAAFANVPIIGGLLSSTIGRLIKPPKIMHANEWARMGAGGAEYASLYEGWKREPSYAMGASMPGIPISPYSAAHALSQVNYQAQELAGLTGWVGSLIQEGLTGKPYWHGDSPVLADASILSSARRTLWDAQLGGMGPLGEIIRRVLPSYPKDVERTNPLLNTMPSWLPDQFAYGDPYAQIPYGEAVLPGPGYAALHPELRGVSPEDYPLLHRYNILSQVSPLSKEFRSTKDKVYRARAAGLLTSEQEAYVDRLDYLTNKRWAGYVDQEFDPNAIRLPGSSFIAEGKREIFKMARKGLGPLEYLTPFRPLQKLLGDRDPIEQYEYERLYGSSVAFWDKPFRDFLRPAMYSLANYMGFSGKPIWRHDADATNELFDKAEFYKWMSLAEQAAAQGDTRDKIRYEYLASNTRMGVNPYGNPLSIYWSLPNEDRTYFSAFATATGKDRERILQMVPADQVHLYKAMWSREDAEDPSLWTGLNTSPDQQYLFSQYNQLDRSQLPADDWIGYNQDVDMRDIKVRYVNQQGKELRDFGLWEQELKKAYSQPYLEGSETAISSTEIKRGWLMHSMNKVFDTSDISLISGSSRYGTMDLNYNDDRQVDIDRALLGQMNGY